MRVGEYAYVLMNGLQDSKSTPAVERGFQEALKKFKARLSSHERGSFQYTTLDDLRLALLQMQDRQARNFENRNLRRVQRFLEGFSQLGQVVEVFLNSADSVGFVWGPMKFILLVSRPQRPQIHTHCN